MKGLTAAARKSDGKPGGVQKIVFVAAGILPEETEASPLPFMEFNVRHNYTFIVAVILHQYAKQLTGIQRNPQLP
jgi:hypothetical protein